MTDTPAAPPESSSPPALDLPVDAPPAVAPWVSTQHEMESAARPSRTRVFRVRMKSGHVRVAGVTYFHASASSHTDSRVHPPAACRFHHGQPWSISMASGTPQIVKAVSSRSRTASPRVVPRPSSAIA